MNKTLFCAVLAVLTAAGNAGAAPKTKVQPRMNYFTERDSVASIIVTGQQTSERAALDDSEAAVTLTKQGKNRWKSVSGRINTCVIHLILAKRPRSDI